MKSGDYINFIIVKFMWSQGLFCLFKTKSRYSRGNIFHENTSFRDEKRPALINFSLCASNKKRAYLFNTLKK